MNKRVQLPKYPLLEGFKDVWSTRKGFKTLWEHTNSKSIRHGVSISNGFILGPSSIEYSFIQLGIYHLVSNDTRIYKVIDKSFLSYYRFGSLDEVDVYYVKGLILESVTFKFLSHIQYPFVDFNKIRNTFKRKYGESVKHYAPDSTRKFLFFISNGKFLDDFSYANMELVSQ